MRAFIGSFLGATTQTFYAQLVADLVTRHGDVLRAIPSGSAHLTYVFVAALDPAQEPAVAAAVRRVTAAHPSVQLGLDTPRVLSAGSSPRLVYAEVTEGADRIRRLADDVAAAVRETLSGTEVSPMKTAHVTLARFRRQASRRDARLVAATLTEPAFARSFADERITSAELVASTLTSSGSVYTILQTCRLG